MATLDSIADEIGFTRNELMQSMVKFGLTNRDWRNEGLTAHKRLPRYQENPGMATKPPSPAQLAARKRFAEMARNGSLNRKRQIAAKKKAAAAAPKSNPRKKTVSQKISQLVHEGYPQKQAVAVALNEQRAGKVKRNPAKVKYRDKSKDMAAHHVAGYAVHKADRPYYLATAWFTNKSDAMEVAQEVADRTGIQYAVTKAVTYFGPK
jgi:hypothetical protein